jgi:type I restriction-modification system DNA methylase subunit
MLDSDLVEAVIQLPSDEFFNTGIYTYLWVFNKNKEERRKGKVMLINASEKYTQLKKSKGSKRKEIDDTNRLDIVATLTVSERFFFKPAMRKPETTILFQVFASWAYLTALNLADARRRSCERRLMSW